MVMTCKSAKYTILPQTRTQTEMITSLNAFFKKKTALDKKAKKTKSEKPKFEFDDNIFEIVDNKGALVSCKREQKVHVDHSIETLIDALSKLKFELLKNKYNILFELVDATNYTELLESIVEPLEKDYSAIQSKLEKLVLFRDNVMKKIQVKRDELIVRKSTLREQLKQESTKEQKSNLMKQYIENQKHILDYNDFLANDVYLFLETDKIQVDSVNNGSYLDNLISNSESGISQEEFVNKVKTKKRKNKNKIENIVSNIENEESNIDLVSEDEGEFISNEAEKNDILDVEELEE
jgi:hypothetical protein